MKFIYSITLSVFSKNVRMFHILEIERMDDTPEEGAHFLASEVECIDDTPESGVHFLALQVECMNDTPEAGVFT